MASASIYGQPQVIAGDVAGRRASKLLPGMVLFTVEPMINAGGRNTIPADGWTISNT